MLAKPFLFLPHSLRFKIFMFALFFLLIALVGVGIVVETQVVGTFEQRLGHNVMNIAETVAAIPVIQEWVGKKGGAAKIQPLAEEIRAKTKASYVVVMDLQSRRYSHPVKERIGQTFVGGDEKKIFQGVPYLSKAVGTLGPSLRAFVPIYRHGEIAGAVSVGTLLTEVGAIRDDLSQKLLLALALGGILGTGGALFLAWNIKRSIRGLEPHEILELLEEREVLLESVREGLLLVDKEGKIRLLNSAARHLFQIKSDVVGKFVEEVFPNTQLPRIIRSGKAEFDQEQRIQHTHILTNRVPLMVQDNVVGALASFRDMTEIEVMAEELTGVRRYLEALRVQKHEFRNQLQTLSGLLHLKEYQRAECFLSIVVEDGENLVSLITKKIRIPEVGGIILAKMGRCRELDITFLLNENSFLGEATKVAPRHLVVIVGNILENAIEATTSMDSSRRKVELAIYHESGHIFISVRDKGQGIPQPIMEKIFEIGVSAKHTSPQGGTGIGLFNVAKLVEFYGGNIQLESHDKGTECIVDIPERIDNETDSGTHS